MARRKGPEAAAPAADAAPAPRKRVKQAVPAETEAAAVVTAPGTAATPGDPGASLADPAAAEPDAAEPQTPLDYMLSIMRNSNNPEPDRVAMARATLPYVHPKPAARKPKRKDGRKKGKPSKHDLAAARRYLEEKLVDVAAEGGAAGDPGKPE